MKKNIFILFYGLVNMCLQEKRISHVFQIHSFIDNSKFIKKHLIHFYDFKEPINLENLILHFKNIIEKTLDLNFVYHILSEYNLDNTLFENNINSVKSKISSLNYSFLKYENFNFLLKKIELKLFKFAFKKLFEIKNWILREDIFIVIMNEDLCDIVKLRNCLRTFKVKIKKKKCLKKDEKENIIWVINETSEILYNFKNGISERLNKNGILKEACKLYLYNIESLQNQDKIDLNVFQFNDKRNIQIVIKNKLDELHDIFKYILDLNNLNDIEKIKLNLYKMAHLILYISKFNLLELEIGHFIKIFIYLNFIRNKIVMEQYNQKNLDFTTKNVEKNYNSKAIKLSETLTFVFSQKDLVNTLICNYFRIVYQHNQENHYKKIIEVKCIIYKNFVELECLYDKLIISNFSKENYIQQYLKILYSRDKMLKHLHKNFCIFKESFLSDFDFFQIQCSLVFSLNTLYLGEKKDYKNKYQNNFKKLISKLIEFINLCLQKTDKKSLYYDAKHHFIKVMVEKLKECNDKLKKLSKKEIKEKNMTDEKIIENFFLTAFQLQNSFLAAFFNNIDTTQSSTIESKNLSDTSTLNSQIQKNSSLKVNENLNDQIDNALKAKKYTKPKKNWEQQWQTFNS
ncbi:hypothetical protein NUSPORA_01597 [Nucleospora cyclopteri]